MPEKPAPNQAPGQGGQNPIPGWPSDRDWPDDEDWPDEAGMAFPWPDPELTWPGAQPPPEPPRGWLRSVAGPAAVAVLAAGGGVALALYFGGSGSPAAGSSTPSSLAPSASPGAGLAPQGGSNGTIPGGGVPGSGGSAGQMFIIGQIVAISSTSITIDAGGQSIVAAITSATKVTGNVHSVAALAVGDNVSAQITETNGTATVTFIQDPPGQPPQLGGGAP